MIMLCCMSYLRRAQRKTFAGARVCVMIDRWCAGKIIGCGCCAAAVVVTDSGGGGGEKAAPAYRTRRRRTA